MVGVYERVWEERKERNVLTIIVSKRKMKTNKQKKQKTVQPHLYPSTWKTKADRYLRKRGRGGGREERHRGGGKVPKLHHLRENENLYQL